MERTRVDGVDGKNLVLVFVYFLMCICIFLSIDRRQSNQNSQSSEKGMISQRFACLYLHLHLERLHWY